ncbi:unnamed protein product, partial [Ectocarpus sp. 12 AP-2014]
SVSRSAAGEERSKSGSGRTSSTNGTEVSRGRHSLLEEGQGECATSSSTWTGVEPFKRGSLLAAGHVRALLIIYGIYMFIISGFEDLFALWALSTTAAGGLDWSAEQIGQVLLASGLMVFVFEMFAVPLVTKRLGVTTSQRLSSVTLVFVLPLVPVLGRLLNTGHLLMIASVGLLFTVYSTCDAFYTCISFAINNAAEPERCGELNGLAACVASVVGAVGPAAWSALYAFSVEVVDGRSPFPFPIDFRLAFWLMAFLRLVVAIL